MSKLSSINDYPFVAFHEWEMRPLEIVHQYEADTKDESHSENVRRLDPIYVRYRELDALRNDLGCILERLNRRPEDLTPQGDLPDSLAQLVARRCELSKCIQDLLDNVDPSELTKARTSLLHMYLTLEGAKSANKP